TEYTLDGPHETVESAKEAYLISYKKTFDIEWSDRHTVVSDKWTVETIVHEEYEEVEEVVEVIEESEAQEIIKIQEKEAQGVKTEETKIIHKDDKIAIEKVVEVKKDIIVAEDVQVKETVTEVTVGHVTKEAVPQGTSWFRRVTNAVGSAADSVGHGIKDAAKGVAVGTVIVAAGAGAAAHGALHKVDGVWKRTVNVLTTHKAKVDEKCPIAKHSVVYYDEDVYDSVLVSKETGVTHINQLLYNSQENKYYVYIRWTETDYKLDGPYTTVEEAKSAFHVVYKDWYGIQWSERETVVSEKWTVQEKIYETYEEEEIIEEIVEEEEAKRIIATETIVGDTKVTETIVEKKVDKEVLLEKDTHVVIKDEHKDQVVIIEEKEEAVVIKPAVPEKSSWFRRAVTGVGAAAHKVGTAVGDAAESVGDGVKKVAVGTAVVGGVVVVGAGLAAAGAVKKV
ncbi:hypothetical protein BGX31_004293, partial [Mortierella sp. GBA43]